VLPNRTDSLDSIESRDSRAVRQITGLSPSRRQALQEIELPGDSEAVLDPPVLPAEAVGTERHENLSVLGQRDEEALADHRAWLAGRPSHPWGPLRSTNAGARCSAKASAPHAMAPTPATTAITQATSATPVILVDKLYGPRRWLVAG
jgi:hypothetical protein